MFKMMAPFVATPPPSSPFDWGKEDRVRALLGDTFDLPFERHISFFCTENGEEYWQIFSTNYGPTKTLAASLGPRAGRNSIRPGSISSRATIAAARRLSMIASGCSSLERRSNGEVDTIFSLALWSVAVLNCFFA